MCIRWRTDDMIGSERQWKKGFNVNCIQNIYFDVVEWQTLSFVGYFLKMQFKTLNYDYAYFVRSSIFCCCCIYIFIIFRHEESTLISITRNDFEDVYFACNLVTLSKRIFAWKIEIQPEYSPKSAKTDIYITFQFMMKMLW